MKIWENFKEYKPFLSSIKKLPNCVCKDCYLCGKPFAEIETEFVHMANDPQGKARYIDDNCLKHYKSTQNEPKDSGRSTGA